nr:MAG TPA: hypothetical protein [Caudoviricetes sp.]
MSNAPELLYLVLSYLSLLFFLMYFSKEIQSPI